jgi:hypothetical protein
LAESAANPAVPAAAIASLREFLIPNLHHHHQSEDEELWPIINAVAPDAAVAMAELSGEHNILDEALDTLEAADIADREAFTGAAVLVRNVVHRHLQDEEPILFPALRNHVTAQAWDGFARHVTETSPTVGAYFMIGFIDQVGTDEQVRLMLGDIPGPTLTTLRDAAEVAFTALNPDRRM